MRTDLYLKTLQKTLHTTDKIPEIFNTGQGWQFASAEWTEKLTELGVKISMADKGRWMGNVFIERLWRSVNPMRIDVHEHATIPAMRSGMENWITRHNEWRPHETLGNLTPTEFYQKALVGPPEASGAPTPEAA